MDDINDSEQLAEVESMLYSQIHHSLDTEADKTSTTRNSDNTSTPIEGYRRYFGNSTVIRKSLDNIGTLLAAASDDLVAKGLIRPEQKENHVQSTPNISDPLPETIPLKSKRIKVPSILPTHPNEMSGQLTKEEYAYHNKMFKLARANILQLANRDAQVVKHLSREDKQKVKRMQKKQKWKERRRERKKLRKQQRLIEKHNQNLEQEASSKNLEPKQEEQVDSDEIIELSETDEDEIVAIEKPIDLVVLSSDDEEFRKIKSEAVEQSVHDSEEVQILATPTPEVIDIEADTSKNDSELMKPPSAIDSSSVSSATSSAHSSDKTVPQTPHSKSLNECIELTNTPESSNDFLDNTLDISERDKFNFSFHGNDLPAGKEFLKPRNLAEVYETESSCSASDISTPLKNAVFHEMDFETPDKGLFGEANLESFSEFITPKRKSTNPSSPSEKESSENAFAQVPTRATQSTSERNDSDSSSESEYDEESKVSKADIEPKRLPNLSYFENSPKSTSGKSEGRAKQVSKTQTTSEKTNDNSLASSSSVLEQEPKTSKKRKPSESSCKQSGTDDENPANISEQSSSSKKRKKPKSKSDTELEESDHKSASSNKTKLPSRLFSKSDTEMDQPIVSTDPKSQAAESMDTPNKGRKKRKSKGDFEIPSNEITDTPCKQISKRPKSENIENIPETTLKQNETIDLETDDESDLEFIENEPPVCIDLSDSDFFKSSDEECFNTEELGTLKANLNLSNLKVEPAHNVWEVQSDEDHALNSNEVKADELNEPEVSWMISGFDGDAILKSLPSDPERWKILERDRIHIRVFEKKPRCNRCRQMGHLISECPRKILKCWLCGGEGHQEPRCPNTVCTSCGRTTRYFTTFCGKCKDLGNYNCKTCECRGHPEHLCPDFWRRYHLTTEVGPIQHAPLKLKPAKERWCSGCAQQGHFEYNCNYYNRTHIPSKPYVAKYLDVYNMHRHKRKDSDNQEKSRQADIKLDITKQVYHLLQSPKGMSFLKEVEKDASLSCENGQYFIKFKDLPDHYEKICGMFNELVSNPTLNYRRIVLPRKELNILSSEEGVRVIKPIMESRKVSYKFEFSPTTCSLCLHGDILNVMSIQFKIPTLIATIVEQTNSKNKQPAKSPKSKGSSKACKVYKVQKSLIDELAKYPQHPFMEKLAEKFNINWNTANNQLKIEGSSEGISGASKSLRGITCAYLVPAFTQVNRINKFLNRVDDLSKDNDIPGMFDRGELENLNIIMFGLHNTNNQGRLIAQMKRYKKTLSNVIMCQQWYDQQITRILDFFKKIRKSQLYTDFVRKVTAELAKNLYSLDERSTNSTEVKLSPDQMTHLFDTYEGSEFFTNFTSNLSFDVVREECKLILHCSGKQKSDAIKRINTYFQILEMPFSTRPLEMRRDLSELLNNVALDYYLFDCKQLYNEIFGGDKVKSNLLRKLHGLLFVKYEFLEGMKHVDMVRNYLDILSTGRYILNHPQQMEVKAAVMYLFSPYPVNVNYQLLIALTTPPVIPRLNLENLGSVIKMLKTKISQVVGFCTDRQNYLKLAELALFESYLSLSNNSREAVHVVSAYLNNNFPFIK